jgi:hypothetical protein
VKFARAGLDAMQAENPPERIVIDRNHCVVPADYVNPLYIEQLEQIHRADESAKAILIDADLLWGQRT